MPILFYLTFLFIFNVIHILIYILFDNYISKSNSNQYYPTILIMSKSLFTQKISNINYFTTNSILTKINFTKSISSKINVANSYLNTHYSLHLDSRKLLSEEIIFNITASGNIILSALAC